MKKLIAVLTALALAALPLLAFGEGSAEDFGGATLNVYNWGEYIDKEVLRSFEKQYNCKVYLNKASEIDYKLSVLD